ncbi:MAG: ABC transporter ATP-binding protein [Candidatus Fermentibacteraceae bacterium]
MIILAIQREGEAIESVVSARGLRKTYGETVALNGLDLEVRRGEVFGIVGPNGAGKTTTIDCIAGMRTRDGGGLSVLGMDPGRNARRLRCRIGLQQQESELPERIRVRESLELFGALFGSAPPVGDLLESVGLSRKADSYFSALSGGQKRRLFVALALVNDPELILLDELTSGLDPRGRRQLWTLVEKARGAGRTVLISTHYMDEAEKLCDRVAIIHRGSVVAVDTPQALIERHCPGIRMRLGCGDGFDPGSALGLEGVLGADMQGGECVMDLTGADAVVPVIRALSEAGANLGDLHTERPTLEDVFMVTTGREYSEVG